MSKSVYPKEFPCPVCGEFCRVGITKKDKPYFVCINCGVQVFIRAVEGLKRFSEFKGSDLLSAMKGKSAAIYGSLYLMNEEIGIKKAQLNKLENKLPLLGDGKIELKIKELKEIIDKLESEYFQQLINN